MTAGCVSDHSPFRRPGDPLARAHGFASPPYGGFAFVEDVEAKSLCTSWGTRYCIDRVHPQIMVTRNLGRVTA